MKILFTLVLVFSIGTSSMAQVDQEIKNENKVEKIKTVEVKDSKAPVQQKIARVYLYKNSRVKKELKFKTKNNKSKLA